MTDHFTAAQKRALEWLPADGSWRINPGRLSAALNSLALRGVVKSEWDFGPRGGRVLRWRLTETGMMLQAERIAGAG
jgi:DNA-binding PadR family transcriptional regulator